jgi:hypothetical protein
MLMPFATALVWAFKEKSADVEYYVHTYTNSQLAVYIFYIF